MDKRHHPSCLCDECVLTLTNPSVVAAIVYRLGLHGVIEDSAYAEQKAKLAVARGLLQAEGKL